jgi:hypothetical protein
MKSLVFLGYLTVAIAQTQTVATPPPPSSLPQTPANPNAAEMETHVDTSASFKSHVNFVQVPVVVRDSHGVAVGDITKANFTLYDKGKPQEIARFTVEKTGSKSLQADATPADADATPKSAEAKGPTVVVPNDTSHSCLTMFTFRLATWYESATLHCATSPPSNLATALRSLRCPDSPSWISPTIRSVCAKP